MRLKKHFTRFSGVLCLFGVVAINPVFGANWKVLPGHVPGKLSQLKSVGRLAATNQMRLAIGVPLRDPAGLDDFLAQLYDPASPNYRHYLTPEEITVRFGPTATEYEAVKNFALTNGLTITATHDNRLLLDVTGPAAAVEKAFHVTLRTYQHPTEARIFYAPDAEPTADASLPVVDVQGLSDYSRVRPRLARKSRAKPVVKSGSAPDGSGGYFGNDFRNAYIPGTTLTGAGQMVGLFQADGYYASDIAGYAAAAGNGRTNIVIQKVLIDGFNGTPTAAGNGEVSLDIEMAMAMAPGLSKIVVFEGNPNFYTPNDILNTMAASNTVKSLSCSWSWGGGPSTTTDSIFKTMGMEGQSFFDASGDTDAFVAGSNNDVDSTAQVNAPSSNPYITQVGGTDLMMIGSGAAWVAETVWNDRTVNANGGNWGSSGGISTHYTIPYWQTNISMVANGGSTTMRNIPDVAMTADNITVYDANGSIDVTGGTSCAAPLWAGFTALINQQAAANGLQPAGFINPAIYALTTSPNYAACFHDVTTGDNTWSSSGNLFYATGGYDLCTGLGSPAGGNLINALTGSLVVSPASGFISSGTNGGPFSVASQSFLFTNLGAASLKWGVVNTSSWLNVSSAAGTLAAIGHTNFTISLSSAANTLASGIFSASVLVTNQNGAGVLLPFALQIAQPMVQNGGFETGTFSGWALDGILNYGGVNNAVTSTASFVHSGTYGAELGAYGGLGYLAQTLATTPGASYLLSFWLANSSSGATQRFQANWNGSTLYSLLNPPVMAWTNLQFLVTATGASTLLQFAEENDPNYFGLDDVSVTVIPPPVFKASVKNGSAFTLTFATSTGLVYQLQYKTNLFQANWINVGSALTANTNALTITDTNSLALSPPPQRFYRVRVSL